MDLMNIYELRYKKTGELLSMTCCVTGCQEKIPWIVAVHRDLDGPDDLVRAVQDVHISDKHAKLWADGYMTGFSWHEDEPISRTINYMRGPKDEDSLQVVTDEISETKKAWALVAVQQGGDLGKS